MTISYTKTYASCLSASQQTLSKLVRRAASSHAWHCSDCLGCALTVRVTLCSSSHQFGQYMHSISHLHVSPFATNWHIHNRVPACACEQVPALSLALCTATSNTNTTSATSTAITLLSINKIAVHYRRTADGSGGVDVAVGQFLLKDPQPTALFPDIAAPEPELAAEVSGPFRSLLPSVLDFFFLYCMQRCVSVSILSS
jgi:hypothetical protein